MRISSPADSNVPVVPSRLGQDTPTRLPVFPLALPLLFLGLALPACAWDSPHEARCRSTGDASLVDVGPGDPAPWLKALRGEGDDSREEWRTAILNLTQIGRPCVPLLVELLHDRESEARLGAAHALKEMEDQAGWAVPALVKLLRDGNAEERRNAALALEGCGRGSTLASGALLDALNDPDPPARCHVVSALRGVQVWSPEIVSALVGALSDDWGGVGQEAAGALASEPAIVDSAMGRVVETIISGNGNGRAAARDLLSRWGPLCAKAMPRLIEGLESPEAREDVCELFEALGPVAESAVPSLLRLLNTGGPPEMAAAARALGRLGPRARVAIPRLRELLEHSENRVRNSAAAALTNLGATTEDAAK